MTTVVISLKADVIYQVYNVVYGVSSKCLYYHGCIVQFLSLIIWLFCGIWVNVHELTYAEKDFIVLNVFG